MIERLCVLLVLMTASVFCFEAGWSAEAAADPEVRETNNRTQRVLAEVLGPNGAALFAKQTATPARAPAAEIPPVFRARNWTVAALCLLGIYTVLKAVLISPRRRHW
jgi:hypothetical protein